VTLPVLPDELRICTIQWNIVSRAAEENLSVCERLLEQTAGFRPDIIVLPEMWSRSFCGSNLQSEARVFEKRLEFCRRMANDLGSWLAAGTLPEQATENRVYNSFILLDSEGNTRLTYRKLHLFRPTGEDNFFLAGTGTPSPCQSGPWSVGAGICFDLRFPELFRVQAKRGANLFLLPAQYPNPHQEFFRVLSRARAIENQACIVSANRTGQEGNFSFFGGSIFVDHCGKILSESTAEEGIGFACFRASDIEKNRRDFPFLELTPVLDEMTHEKK